MTNNTTELLPCPCCNGQAYSTKGYAIENVWPHGTFYRVFCGTCQLRQLFYKTEEEAIAAWNRRSAAHGEPSNVILDLLNALRTIECEPINAEFTARKAIDDAANNLQHWKCPDCGNSQEFNHRGCNIQFSKAGSAEQVSERDAFEKFASAEGNGTWLAKNANGSYQSIEIGDFWKYFRNGYRAAIQSAPERKALSDDILRRCETEIMHIIYCCNEQSPPFAGDETHELLAEIRKERALLAQASAQSTDAQGMQQNQPSNPMDTPTLNNTAGSMQSTDAVQIIQELIDSHKRDTGECDDQCDIVDGMLAARDAVIAASEYQVVDANEMIRQSTDAESVK